MITDALIKTEPFKSTLLIWDCYFPYVYWECFLPLKCNIHKFKFHCFQPLWYQRYWKHSTECHHYPPIICNFRFCEYLNCTAEIYLPLLSPDSLETVPAWIYYFDLSQNFIHEWTKWNHNVFALCVWRFILLEKMKSSRFIQVVYTWISITWYLFRLYIHPQGCVYFLQLNNIPFNVYATFLLIHSFLSGHLGCFYVCHSE